jgi:hypothetical protein
MRDFSAGVISPNEWNGGPADEQNKTRIANAAVLELSIIM